MSKKVLVVLTNTARYPSLKRATGLWLGEAVHFVAVIEKAGYKVDYVSPAGGYVPIDPHSLSMAPDLDWQWYDDKAFMNRLGATLAPDQVKAQDYHAIYFTGGHGVIWDFPDNAALQALARDIYEAGGVVSSVCHGAVGLLNIKLSDGALLVAGKRVTGFSNTEEKLAQLDQHVPFLTETELVRRGAHYEKAPEPWLPFAIADQRLITGQNPGSSAETAALLVKHLGASGNG